jgi:hypothetical protein
LLKDGVITIPSGSDLSSSAPDYSAQMAVLQQLVDDIPVHNSQTTVTLSDFVYRVLQAYTVMSN